MERVGRPSALLTVGLAVAAVVLVALVATGDRVPLATEGSGGWHLDRRPEQITQDQSGDFAPLDPGPTASELPGEGVFSVLAQAAVILVGLTALLLTGRALARLVRRSSEPFESPPEEHWPEPTREMVDAVDDGLVALRSGPVDEVIVACWVGLEDAAAAAGMARGVAETPAELASRVLGDLHAPAPAVAGLLERYRRARYSHHPLDEDDRAVAIRALRQIRAAIAGAPA